MPLYLPAPAALMLLRCFAGSGAAEEEDGVEPRDEQLFSSLAEAHAQAAGGGHEAVPMARSCVCDEFADRRACADLPHLRVDAVRVQ